MNGREYIIMSHSMTNGSVYPNIRIPTNGNRAEFYIACANNSQLEYELDAKEWSVVMDSQKAQCSPIIFNKIRN